MSSKKFQYVMGIRKNGEPLFNSITVGTGLGQCALGEGKCNEHLTRMQWEAKQKTGTTVDLKALLEDISDDEVITIDEYTNGVEYADGIDVTLIPYESGTKEPVAIKVFDYQHKHRPTSKEGKFFARIDKHEAQFMDMDEKQHTFTQIAFNGKYDSSNQFATYRYYGEADGYIVYEISFEDSSV